MKKLCQCTTRGVIEKGMIFFVEKRMLYLVMRTRNGCRSKFHAS